MEAHTVGIRDADVFENQHRAVYRVGNVVGIASMSASIAIAPPSGSYPPDRLRGLRQKTTASCQAKSKTCPLRIRNDSQVSSYPLIVNRQVFIWLGGYHRAAVDLCGYRRILELQRAVKLSNERKVFDGLPV